MNTAKIILSAVATIAAIGGTFALKYSKAVTNVRILYENTQNPDGICSTQAFGYAYESVAAGVAHLYFIGNATVTTLSFGKPCSTKFYRFGH